MTAEKYQLLPALPMHIATLHLRCQRLGPDLFVARDLVGVHTITSEVAHCALGTFLSARTRLLNPYDPKIVFLSGCLPATHAMKSVAAHDFPC